MSFFLLSFFKAALLLLVYRLFYISHSDFDTNQKSDDIVIIKIQNIS